MAVFRPIYGYIDYFYRFYNRAYPLLYYILFKFLIVGLIYNVNGKPAIFLCGRYVASV